METPFKGIENTGENTMGVLDVKNRLLVKPLIFKSFKKT